MFPFYNLLSQNIPIFFFDDIFDQGPGLRIPRPPYTNQQFRENIPKPTNLKKQMSVKKTLDMFTPQQGYYWAILGEQEYEKNNFEQAIEHFTKAIEITDGTESVFFRNRGEAYKQQKNLEKALKDAIQAIELDDKNIKAHLLCGQVLAEIGKFENQTNNIEMAIVRLTKAMTLCAGQKKQYYENELSKYIYRAKKLLWYKQQEALNRQKEEAINNYIKYVELKQNISEEEKKIEIQNFISSIGDPKKAQNLEIPSYLICKITLELMENPVTTEAGMTYERDVLIEAIEKNGPIDPATRQPISRAIYPNQNIKQAIQYFLLNNPWAFEFESGEDYHNIQF